MLSLREVASGLCRSCSYEDSVFRKSFEAASHGIESAKPQISATPAPAAPSRDM